MIEIKNLKIDRAGRLVLDLKNLKLESGKVTAILGPNGSGKTTLLESLALGRVDGVPKKGIALLLQRPTLFDKSVLDNVSFGLAVRSVKSEVRNQIAREMLKKLGIDHLENKRASMLSGGEKQRVSLASLLILKPLWLLLDEPFANIDTQNREIIKHIIFEEAKNGTGVVFTSHCVPDAMAISDRIYHLFEGNLSEEVMENIFTVDICEDGNERYFEFPRRQRIFVSGDAIGRARVSIDPNSIILSRKTLSSSARNSIIGKITSISVNRGKVRVELDVGVRLNVVITEKSLEELKLMPCNNVIVSFKATAVKVMGSTIW